MEEPKDQRKRRLDAERQARRKNKQLTAGLVQWKCWTHRADVPALAEFAQKLGKAREQDPTK